MENKRGFGLWYQKATEHDRRLMKGHVLDWESQPDVYKAYPSAERVPLVPLKDLDATAFADLVREGFQPPRTRKKNLEALSAILAMGSGITCQRKHGFETYSFRSAASAGALYPVDLYVDAMNVEGLEPGLYHDHIGRFALERLKTNREPARTDGLFAVIYLTGVYFRSFWKYRDRAYRYILNDAGHVAANLALAARALGFSVRLDYDFDDRAVNRFLGLDDAREVCLSRLSLYGLTTENPETELSPFLWGMTQPMPKGDYGKGCVDRVSPVIRRIHEAGVMDGTVFHEKPEPVPPTPDLRHVRWLDQETPSDTVSGLSFGKSLVLRRSRRNFQARLFGRPLFFALVDRLMNGSDLLKQLTRMETCVKPAVLVQNVEGLDPGYYLVDAEKKQLGCVDEGSRNALMAGACLDQRWLAGASVHVVMTGDLSEMENRLGPRAYRYAMMNAGFLGQIVYLAATSLNLGCCGVGAYFDREVADILDLGSDGEVLFYLLAAGPVKS